MATSMGWKLVDTISRIRCCCEQKTPDWSYYKNENEVRSLQLQSRRVTSTLQNRVDGNKGGCDRQQIVVVRFMLC